jgi:hypothetical protein
MKVGSGTFKSRVRLVKKEVSEIERGKLPHLLRNECGNKALVTVYGRPPLCLKCMQIGHYRSNCSSTPKVLSDNYFRIQKSFSESNQNRKEKRRKITDNRIKDEEEAKMKKDQEIMDDKNDDGDDDGDDDDDEMDESVDKSRGTKRGQDQEVTYSFRKHFPPFKTRRPAQAPLSIDQTNRFTVLDLDTEDTPLVIDDSEMVTHEEIVYIMKFIKDGIVPICFLFR